MVEPSQLKEEVRQWNTPLIGGYLLWCFTEGYVESHEDGDSPFSLLHFFATAILTSPRLLEGISRKRENLQSYIKSFEEKKDVDILLGIQERIDMKKEYTLASIDAAISAGLLVWETNDGKIYPRSLKSKPSRGKKLKPDIKRVGDKARVLGNWFSEHDIQTISSYFKVVL